MKDFLKIMLATMAGFLALIIVLGIVSALSIVGMVSASENTVKVEPHSVMTINLSGLIEEQGKENLLGSLTGNNLNSIGLNDIREAIRKARDNEHIEAIYLECGPVLAGQSSLEAIRDALADFRKTGKKVVAYGDNYTQGAYYVASVADRLWINPVGMIDWHGLAVQTQYVKDLMAKIGIKYQVIKVGTFKSATEQYTETQMSPANREQLTALLGNNWDLILGAVSKSRKVSRDSLNAWADRLIMSEPTSNYVRYKLVDKTLYANEVKGELEKFLGLGDEELVQMSVSEVLSTKDDKSDREDQIAVYYAEGPIYQSASTGLMSMETSINAQKVCDDLADLAEDEDVKAVVLRVNSPGGDAFASEQMWQAVRELKKKKPVVVSMGDYAASGGYYMSCNASWIVAQPSTLTGSIGIFGVIPDVSDLMNNKLGLHFDEVKTNRNSTMGATNRPLNADELRAITAYVNRGYSLFRSRVAEGRKLKVEQVEAIAQGRVWSGRDAIKCGLVDEIGGLDAAVAKAARLAKAVGPYVEEYPAAPGWMDQLLGGYERGSYLDGRLREQLGVFYQPIRYLSRLGDTPRIEARLPYEFMIR